MTPPISHAIAALVRKAAAQSSELLHSAASRSATTYRSAATGVRGTDEVARGDHKSATLIRWAAVGGATALVLTQVDSAGIVAEETGTEDDSGTGPTGEGRAGSDPYFEAPDRATDPLDDEPHNDSRDRLDEHEELEESFRNLLGDSRGPAGPDEQNPGTAPHPISPDWIGGLPEVGPPPSLGGSDDPATGADNRRPSDDPSKYTRSGEGEPAPPPGDSGNEPPLGPPSIGGPAGDPFDQD
ncbi:hypothetical protein [Nocardia carnea]|uniref:hypothetical protein n=1 Tax=Nocardia carnea TaxID=37328 RepID=UPI002456A7AD|nr:hypothetical protein [Nocardia carnea]